MQIYKNFIAESLFNKRVRMKCDCIIKLDISGIVVGYTIKDNEIIYHVNTGEKIIRIGENTPKLYIEIL